MIRTLFRIASILTTAKVVSSGNPGRITKHIVRRQSHKLLARMLRKLL